MESAYGTARARAPVVPVTNHGTGWERTRQTFETLIPIPIIILPSLESLSLAPLIRHHVRTIRRTDKNKRATRATNRLQPLPIFDNRTVKASLLASRVRLPRQTYAKACSVNVSLTRRVRVVPCADEWAARH